MNDLIDRVDFCIVKANCGGKSVVSDNINDPGRHVWQCQQCGGYVSLPKGEQPIRPRKYPFGGRGE